MHQPKNSYDEGAQNPDKTIEVKHQGNSQYYSVNGTKSTTALGSMANLIAREAAMNQAVASQVIAVRSSIGSSVPQNVNLHG